MKRFPLSRGPRRSGVPWRPNTTPPGLSPERGQALESDDLAELLAATNVKRTARGKAPLSQDDVAMQLWATEQDMRRGRGH